MEISKLACPNCGASITEEKGKTFCEYCGSKLIIESKSIGPIEKTDDNAVNHGGGLTREVFKSVGDNTQIELRRLQMTQELSALQMQLSNLRSEKRSLSLVQKKTAVHTVQLQQIDEEERYITSRINIIQSALFPQQDHSPSESVLTVENKAPGSNKSQSIAVENHKSRNPKSQSLALVLAVFFGWCGAHRFYTGHKIIGFVYLFSAGLFGVGWIIDVLLILLNFYKDSEQRFLTPMGSFAKVIGVTFLSFIILVTWIIIDPDAPPIILIISVLIAVVIANLKKIWTFILRKSKKTDKTSS